MTEIPHAISIGAKISNLAWDSPSADCVTFEGVTLTRQELHLSSNRMAHALAARGVGLGDFVSIALPNGLDFVVATFAVLKLGAIPQPVSGKLPERELEAIISLARPRVVIRAAATRPSDVTPGILIAETIDETDLPDRISPALKAPTSGGSTGQPKLIVSGRAGIVLPGEEDFYGIKRSDIAVMPAPLYHNAPFSLALVAILAGAHLVLMRKFDPENLLQIITRRQATWLYLVPTMMHRIWQLPQEARDRSDISSLRKVWHMAAPCPPRLKEAWIGWIGAEKLWELYGGTESQAVTVIGGQDWLGHRGSVGRPVIGEIAILDDEGRRLAPGTVGTVYLRMPSNAAPTYRYIGARAERIGEWETLGDLGWMDQNDYLYLTDRRTDMILVGGANVYPAEVEAALEEHPLVTSSAVIGLPDEDLGHRVHAIVQTSSTIDLDELNRHLAERLVSYKRPRSIEIVAYPLRDDAGKVRRFQLRADRVPGAASSEAPRMSNDERLTLEGR
ncbi:bile acid-coenzyme A ligase [Bradyrhizobium elkanii]|uniref:AMP-binding protein n=1 Tax=Bradyrhizobium elkanii TaxID=29448 RepID=UPI0035160CBC